MWNPRLEIFGGDGEGAAGDLILGNIIEKFDEESGGIVSDVQRTGSIIGVDITYHGEGYTEEPLSPLLIIVIRDMVRMEEPL